MPAITRWSRSSPCSGRGARSSCCSSVADGGVRPRLGTEGRQLLVGLELLAAVELDPRGLLGAELPQAQLTAVIEAQQQP